MPTWNDLKDVGPFISLVACLLYGAYVLIPKALAVVDRLVVEFRAELKESRAAAAAELKEARASFSSELHETRTQFADELEKRDKAIEKLAAAVDRISEKVSK